MTFVLVLGFTFLVVIFLSIAIRVLILLNSRGASWQEKHACKTLVVIGSGGHTSEMMSLLEGVSQKFTPRLYVIADTDMRGLKKVEDFERKRSEIKMYSVLNVKRSREVAQSWLSTVYTTFLALLQSIRIIWKHRPQLVLCNGPGTCVPICIAVFLLQIFYIADTKILFIESICRVKSLSLTGRILYHFADKVLVQWPELKLKYPKTEYLGRLI